MEKVKCTKCKKFYPSNMVCTWKQTYYKHALPQSLCRPCMKEKKAKYRKTPKGREIEIRANKKYVASEKGKIAVNRASKKAYINHKEKWIARAKARYAVSKGIIKKPKKCEVCEQIKPLQGHHEDYTKPLEVIFLCYSCHADADRFLKELND